MPDADSTLRLIAQWKHIIVADLTSTWYQIPLPCDSMKYCRVTTPFRGVQVYAWSAMGMLGSETALEELMNRVLGELLKEGIIAKIPDDLYCTCIPKRTPMELGESFTGPAQVWSSPFCIQNDHQPSVHNDTRLGLELWHSQCQPSSHRRSSLVPWTRHRYPNKVIHQSIQGALLRYPRMLFTSCNTQRHCCRPWI